MIGTFLFALIGSGNSGAVGLQGGNSMGVHFERLKIAESFCCLEYPVIETNQPEISGRRRTALLAKSLHDCGLTLSITCRLTPGS